MTDQEKIQLAIQVLKEDMQQLESWANESVQGGWSTHQVGPQRARAMQLARTILHLQS